jgi:hypothetical protein
MLFAGEKLEAVLDGSGTGVGGSGTRMGAPQSGQGPASGRVSGIASSEWQWGQGNANLPSGSWRSTPAGTCKGSVTTEKNVHCNETSRKNHPASPILN